jgi:hypothetical protein
MIKRKYWTVSVYANDTRIACFTFDNIQDAIEKIFVISKNDDEVDEFKIEMWFDPA